MKSHKIKAGEPHSLTQLISRAKRMFKCDTARITSPCGRHFLVIGWKKNTKTERESGRDVGQWYRNGEPIDFDFVNEQVIANGRTLTSLWNSVKHYKRLLTSMSKT